MKQCDLCSENNSDGKDWVIFTGLYEGSSFSSSRSAHISKFSEFVPHSFFVCKSCIKKRLIIIIIASLYLAITFFLIGDKHGQSATVAIFGPTLVIPIIILYYGQMRKKLKKIAIKIRKSENNHRKVRAFSESEFSKLESTE